jgi:DNA end-binding protein Ku
VDADTGEVVSSDDIMKGYKVDTDTCIEVSKDELENIALESTRTIDIDEFVPKSDIDPRYLIRPYYLVPDGKVGHDAFAVIRETIRNMDMVAIGRVVLTNREHIIALEPLDNGLMGTLLRYPYEVRDEKEYFDEIQDVKVTKDMLDLAKHIVTQKAGTFEPAKFEDHYEEALTELINAKRNGKTVGQKPRPRGENVVDLMDALKKSLATEATTTKGKKPRKASAGQKEMLLPIEGKRGAEKKAAKPVRASGRRKAGKRFFWSGGSQDARRSESLARQEFFIVANGPMVQRVSTSASRPISTTETDGSKEQRAVDEVLARSRFIPISEP